MKREAGTKIIAFVFTASILCSFAYILQDIRYALYSLIPCGLAVYTYVVETKKRKK